MNIFETSNMLSISLRTIEEERQELNGVAKYFQDKWYYEYALNHLAEKRRIPKEAFKALDMFFINTDELISELPEWMLDRSHGLVYNEMYHVYDGRFIFPIKDVKGNVMGFVGYIWNEEPKYKDSRTFGYKAKLTTLYGMEKLPEYYTSSKPVFIVEGIMDVAYLRYHGHNTLALLTSKIGEYQATILNRLGDRCIVIADNDTSGKFSETRTAGEGLVKQALNKLPKARVFQTVRASDINDVIRLDDGKYEKQVLQDLQAMYSYLCMPAEFRQRGKAIKYGRVK